MPSGRLFNLASDVMQPEQEYYLQPVEPGRYRNAASICPVDFSFGGDHLWDRFSVRSVYSSYILLMHMICIKIVWLFMMVFYCPPPPGAVKAAKR